MFFEQPPHLLHVWNLLRVADRLLDVGMALKPAARLPAQAGDFLRRV